MSKICVLVDLNLEEPIGSPNAYAEACAAANQLKALERTVQYRIPGAKISVMPPWSFVVTRSVTLTRMALNGNELVMTDQESGFDITTLSDAEQAEYLAKEKVNLERCRICGWPLNVISSYVPQISVNAGTLTALNSLGIQNIGVDAAGFKPVVPTAIYGEDLIPMLGSDIVLYINTRDLPANPSPNDWAYPADLMPFLDAAKASGASFVKMCDF